MTVTIHLHQIKINLTS